MIICDECLEQRYINKPGIQKSEEYCDVCGQERSCSSIPVNYLVRKGYIIDKPDN